MPDIIFFCVCFFHTFLCAGHINLRVQQPGPLSPKKHELQQYSRFANVSVMLPLPPPVPLVSVPARETLKPRPFLLFFCFLPFLSFLPRAVQCFTSNILILGFTNSKEGCLASQVDQYPQE